MIELALEFSSRVRSVAVLNVLPCFPPAAVVLASISDEQAQAAKPFTLIEWALNDARVEREAIECIVVGLGPGSYTGIRSAIAIAQGWQLALGIKLLGVGSVEALARQAQQLGWRGQGYFAIDAQRGEFYVAACEIRDQETQALQPLRIVSREEIDRLSRSAKWLAGPGLSLQVLAGRDLYPDAGALGAIAAQRTDFVPGETLEPIYLRETQFVKTASQRK